MSSNEEPRPPPPTRPPPPPTTTATRPRVVDGLTPRIRSGLETVRAWDADPSLLEECRTLIPFHLLAPELHRNPGRRSSSSGSAGGAFPPSVSGLPDDLHDLESERSECVRPDDVNYEGDELLLKRLTLFFQKSVMTWVNAPDCVACGTKGSDMKGVGVRGPETVEEREGGASRVELYHCPKCDRQTTTFPRYNSPRKLHETRRGRCGEYANLFGLYCRSVGFDARYVSDYTDHVWIEVYSASSDRWIMADACEGKIDVPSMYERGWGKRLSYVIGTTTDSVSDVTKRYTRNFFSDEFQERRRAIFGGTEAESDAIVAKMDALARSSENATKNRIVELDRRSKEERSFFETAQRSGKWPKGEEYGEGRISGSLAWRTARREVGNDDDDGEGGKDDDVGAEDGNGKGGTKGPSSSSESSSPFHAESFHPNPPLPPSSTNRAAATTVTVAVIPPPPSPPNSPPRPPRRDRIRVSDVPCAASGLPGTVSVVVVDERHLGCVLQSRSFDAWTRTSRFVDTVPDGRIVAICGAVRPTEEEARGATGRGRGLGRLGGFRFPDPLPPRGEEDDDGGDERDDYCVLYVGRIGRTPAWSACRTSPGCSGIRVRIEAPPRAPSGDGDDDGAAGLRLRAERGAVPRIVRRRLPDEFLALKEQVDGTERAKREAFLSYVSGGGGSDDDDDRRRRGGRSVSGYVTKKGSPVYLFDRSGFPLRRFDAVVVDKSKNAAPSSSSTWCTFHYLPSELVPEGDDLLDREEGDGDEVGAAPPSGGPKFDAPVDESFFVDLLGPTLLTNAASTPDPTLIDTVSALRNSRLVALYFSAHWCPPCRRFTPTLIELYRRLKDEIAPNHGLEIAFVSSDRDEAQFSNYFGTMPWTALPYERGGGGGTARRRASSRFGIRGIPALVVLDSLSGRVVVSADQSRSDVSNAARLGDVGITNLFERWIATTPQESQAVMESLELSCEDALDDDDDDEQHPNDVPPKETDDGEEGPNPYLVRSVVPETAEGEAATKTAVVAKDDEDPSARIKELFAGFVSRGTDPTAAAAKAIETAASERKGRPSSAGGASSSSTTDGGVGGDPVPDDDAEGGGGPPRNEGGAWSTIACLRCVAPPSSSSRPSGKAAVACFNDFNAFEEEEDADGGGGFGVARAGPGNVAGARLLRRDDDGVVVGVQSVYGRPSSSSSGDEGDDDVPFGRKWVAPSIAADGGDGASASASSWSDAPSSGTADERRRVAAVSVTTTDAGVRDLKLTYEPPSSSSRDGGSSSRPPPEGSNDDDAAAAAASAAADDDEGDAKTFATRVPRGYELVGFHGTTNSTAVESIGLICGKRSKTEGEEERRRDDDDGGPGGKGERADVDEGAAAATATYGEPEIDRAARRIVESNPNDPDALATVASTAKRYLSNVVRNPSAFRYRSFRVGNRVFDNVAKIDFGIELLLSLGFAVRCSDVDFVATVPLASDLDRMSRDLDRVLERCRREE